MTTEKKSRSEAPAQVRPRRPPSDRHLGPITELCGAFQAGIRTDIKSQRMAEEIAFFKECGLSDQRIADRFGIQLEALLRFYLRHPEDDRGTKNCGDDQGPTGSSDAEAVGAERRPPGAALKDGGHTDRVFCSDAA